MRRSRTDRPTKFSIGESHSCSRVSTMDLSGSPRRRFRERAKTGVQGLLRLPLCACTSVNEEIVHGIPSAKRVLKAGDIVSIDCGVVIDGYYGDSAITVPVELSLPPESKSCSR